MSLRGAIGDEAISALANISRISHKFLVSVWESTKRICKEARKEHQQDMSEDKPKWTMEKVRNEIYEARTKLFVVTKVLETGSLNPEEHPEWVLVIKPLLREIDENVAKIRTILGEEVPAGEA